MISRFRHVAPAGAPIRAADLVAGLAGLAARGDVRARLEREVRERFEVACCVPVSTGRAALALLLRALSDLGPPDRREVVVPSYTCYSVPASVVKAGLRPRLVDVDPATLDFDHARLERMDTARVLAIVATNLYGLPNDLPRLAEFARQRGIFLVDDAAQAMGAQVGGRASGTWGDAGLFSLDKGKNVSAMDGGLLVTRSPRVAAAIERRAAALPPAAAAGTARDLAKLVAYAALLRPWLYWIPNGIPQLGLGRTEYRTDFPEHAYSSLLAAVALRMLPRLDHFTAERRDHAAALLNALDRVPGLTAVAPLPASHPVYLRLPLLVTDPGARAPLLDALGRAGIGATASYPSSLADVPALAPDLHERPADVAGGRFVAERIVTIPTHPYVTADDVARTAAVVRDTLASRREGGAAVASRRPTA